MKFAGPCFILAALLLSASAWAQNASSAATDTPYATIVARNMFGLVPIPIPDPDAGKPPPEPPPKITPTGIMMIFGRDQVLFRAAGKPKPGQAAKEDAFVLAEGERQEDIEVVKIDRVNGIITFNNHGTIQSLPLVPAKDSGPAITSGGGAPVNPMMGVPRPGPMSAADRATMRARQFGAAMNGGNPMQPNVNTQPNLGGGFQSSGNTQPQNNIEDQVMNAARDIATIEQNRIETQDLVDQGFMPSLPKTMMTPPDAHVGSEPLIQNPAMPAHR